jgi:hypothetical protein
MTCARSGSSSGSPTNDHRVTQPPPSLRPRQAHSRIVSEPYPVALPNSHPLNHRVGRCERKDSPSRGRTTMMIGTARRCARCRATMVRPMPGAEVVPSHYIDRVMPISPRPPITVMRVVITLRPLSSCAVFSVPATGRRKRGGAQQWQAMLSTRGCASTPARGCS